MEKLHFHFLSQSYHVFLAGDDNYEPLEQEMNELFEQRNQETHHAIERLNAENEQLTSELAGLNENAVTSRLSLSPLLGCANALPGAASRR